VDLYQLRPRQAWDQITVDPYHQTVLDRIAKRVSAVHTRRSAEWLRLVGYVYAGTTLPPAVAASVERLQMYCEGKLKPPKRAPVPKETTPYEIEDEDW
jgi:hypothetical protein